jgi:hypothetical protein
VKKFSPFEVYGISAFVHYDVAVVASGLQEREDMEFGKMQIVNLLAAFHGHTSFLEIATGSTGQKFEELDRSLFKKCHRLGYNLQGSHDSDVEFRSDTLDISECVSQIESRGERYDIIFVDPYHDYECSWRDLEFAHRNLNAGGTMVVHDCLPPSGGPIISPTQVTGEWCGLTFIAYVDFLMKQNVCFATVDCDYGCGIIRNIAGGRECFGELRFGWNEARRNHERAFEMLSAHKNTLLNLVDPYAFLKAFFLASPRAEPQLFQCNSTDVLVENATSFAAQAAG